MQTEEKSDYDRVNKGKEFLSEHDCREEMKEPESSSSQSWLPVSERDASLNYVIPPWADRSSFANVSKVSFLSEKKHAIPKFNSPPWLNSFFSDKTLTLLREPSSVTQFIQPSKYYFHPPNQNPTKTIKIDLSKFSKKFPHPQSEPVLQPSFFMTVPEFNVDEWLVAKKADDKSAFQFQSSGSISTFSKKKSCFRKVKNQLVKTNLQLSSLEVSSSDAVGILADCTNKEDDDNDFCWESFVQVGEASNKRVRMVRIEDNKLEAVSAKAQSP